MHQPAIGNLPFGALAKDALQIGNWIGRIGERIGPLLLEMRMNDLPHNRVSQIFFAFEVMKHCAFGRTRFSNDAIETTAQKSVFVKFVESGIEDSLSLVFGRRVGGYSHCASTNQYRPVGMSSSSIFLFSILEFSHLPGLCDHRHGEGSHYRLGFTAREELTELMKGSAGQRFDRTKMMFQPG